MGTTSIGRGPASGGNENHDGDPRNKTLGEKVGQEPPAGNEEIEKPKRDAPKVAPDEDSMPDPSEQQG